MGALTFLARRFVAGDSADQAIAVVRRLNVRGIRATLDFLGEETLSREAAAKSADEIISLLRKIGEAKVDSNVSVKLTQFGMALDPLLAKAHMVRILKEAAANGNFVRIDMEGSAYTQKTLDLFLELFPKFPNCGVVLQAYLRRSAADVERLNAAGAKVRLCKGAYKEPASVAFPGKAEVDRSYDELARELLAKGCQPAIATHDDARIAAAQSAAADAGLSKDKYEFQMLYGLRQARWHELAAEGHIVRIYVPYGTHWLPYYYRRIRERKENLLFVVKNLWRG